MKLNIKIILAIALLICLLPMPYGYYILIRYVSTIIFCIMAYNCFSQNQKELCIIYVVLATLFQPILKLPLGREVWNFVDVSVAMFLIYLFLKERYEKRKR